MSDSEKPICSECEGTFEFPEATLGRRDFIRVAGAGAAAVGAGKLLIPATARAAEDKPAETKPAAPKKPAEDFIIELYKSLTADQKEKVARPFNHGADKNRPTRLTIAPNRALNQPIGKVYTKLQQEIIDKILQAVSSGEDGYRKITRNGTFDASKSLQGCGADFFGDPTSSEPYAFLFTGHHLTVRSDGNFSDGVAWGGPIYYGHSPHGYSRGNIFYYQTKSVLSVYEVLTPEQRKKATAPGNPGEGAGSVRFKKKAEERPGIAYADLSKEQKQVVEAVMREILSPYRKEDADEVMDIIKKTGGMEKIQLAFYPDGRMNDKEPWHFWRLEGPGFVWNYRVLPHVHTYVNISRLLG